MFGNFLGVLQCVKLGKIKKNINLFGLLGENYFLRFDNL